MFAHVRVTVTHEPGCAATRWKHLFAGECSQSPGAPAAVTGLRSLFRRKGRRRKGVTEEIPLVLLSFLGARKGRVLRGAASFCMQHHRKAQTQLLLLLRAPSPQTGEGAVGRRESPWNLTMR